MKDQLSDLDFIEQQNWPQWPLLPLVERSTRDCGFLYAGQGAKVWRGNVWAIYFDGKKAEDFETVEYKDFAALLEHWRID